MDELAAFSRPEEDWAALATVLLAARSRSVQAIGSCLPADHPLLRLCDSIGVITRSDSIVPADDGELADVVVLVGHLNWHHVRRVLNQISATCSARSTRLPLIVIALDGDDPIPAWLNYAERCEQLRRQRAQRTGVELAVRAFASEQSPALKMIWLTPTRCMGVLVGPELSRFIPEHRGTALRPTVRMDADAFLSEHVCEGISIGELERLARGNARVTYVLPVVAANGGVLSVLQLANELFLLGMDVRIATPRLRQEIFRWRFLRKPLVFRDPAHLVEALPQCDLAIATHWTTAEWVRDLVASGRAKRGAYFLQDYEVWFFPETDSENREVVRRTYTLFADKIVKSDWLTELMRNDGYPTHKIALGMDLGFFFPRPVEKPSRPLVVAMGRPRTPRRGFESVVPALRFVTEEIPDIDISLFGQDLSDVELPFPFRNEGVVFDQEQLARLYSSATVHLDGSDFQAFGRPALEAMACGVVSVLTDVGGVSEYARHEENCLLVPPRDPRAFADAMLRLLRSPDLRNKLRKGGFETVRNYCVKREGRETLALFNRICDAEPSPMPARAGTSA